VELIAPPEPVHSMAIPGMRKLPGVAFLISFPLFKKANAKAKNVVYLGFL